MGVQVRLQLFDRVAYRRLADALRRWERAREAAPLAEVLRETLANVRAHAPARAALEAREREIGRQLEALPMPSGPELESQPARFQQATSEVVRSLQAAQETGDPLALFLAMQAGSNAVANAFHEAAATDPARTVLLADLFELSEDPPGPRWIEEEQLERTIASLADPVSALEQREEAVREIRPLLVEAHAIAWDREPRADVGVGRGDLPRWFIESSDWLGDVVAGGGASGERLELAGSTRLFTPDDLARFRHELGLLPSPPSLQLARQVDRVRRLVDLALSDPSLALGLSVG